VHFAAREGAAKCTRRARSIAAILRKEDLSTGSKL
jgi:hypothetical protein